MFTRCYRKTKLGRRSLLLGSKLKRPAARKMPRKKFRRSVSLTPRNQNFAQFAWNCVKYACKSNCAAERYRGAPRVSKGKREFIVSWPWSTALGDAGHGARSIIVLSAFSRPRESHPAIFFHPRTDSYPSKALARRASPLRTCRRRTACPLARFPPPHSWSCHGWPILY